MKSFTSICLNKNGKTPIYKQLGDALLSLITEGILEQDSKLPPIRKMSASLKINSSTVVNAYKYLESKRAVYCIVGSGTYVAPIKNEYITETGSKILPRPSVAETNIKCDFASLIPAGSLFPVNEVKAAFNNAVDKELGGFFLNGGNASEVLLDNYLTRLAQDGISFNKNCCFITESINNAVELACSSVISKGDYVIMEKPVSYSIAGIYLAHGAKIIQASLNANGIDLDIFETLIKLYRPKAAHISTYFQIPTNACYSIENKRTLIELCYKYGVIIIEEDLYGDLINNGKKALIKSLDYRGQVIYVKSITKTCLPWFNANICVFPKKYAPSTDSIQLYPPASAQIKILNELLSSFGYENQLKKIVKNHENTYVEFSKLIDKKLGGFIEYNMSATGVCFWLKLKKGDSTELAQNAAKRGVLITPGNVYLGGESNYFKMCPKGLEPEKLLEGLIILQQELTKIANR